MAINFKSKAAYKRYLAYGHIHDKFHGKQAVTIRGKAHKVQHATSKKMGRKK